MSDSERVVEAMAREFEGAEVEMPLTTALVALYEAFSTYTTDSGDDVAGAWMACFEARAAVTAILEGGAK